MSYGKTPLFVRILRLCKVMPTPIQVKTYGIHSRFSGYAKYMRNSNLDKELGNELIFRGKSLCAPYLSPEARVFVEETHRNSPG